MAKLFASNSITRPPQVYAYVGPKATPRPDEERFFYNRKKYLFFLDPGHGHADSTGQHKSRNSPTVYFDRYQIHEGYINRSVVYQLSCMLDFVGIRHIVTTEIGNQNHVDQSLQYRCDIANDIKNKNPDRQCVFISIHHNWYKNTTARGFEVFAYGHPGSDSATVKTPGQHIANEMGRYYKQTRERPERPLRRKSPVTYYKKERFSVLRNTQMPAILTEWCFMSNPTEAVAIISGESQTQHARYLYECICEIVRRDMANFSPDNISA